MTPKKQPSYVEPTVKMEDVRGLVIRAREAAAKLHRMTDLLNEKITEVEDAFCRVGLTVPVKIGFKQSAEKNRFVSVLHYRKWNNRWCFTIDDGEDIIPLLEANRAERLNAVGRFPDLLLQLANEVESTAYRVEGRVGTAADIADKIRLVARDEV